MLDAGSRCDSAVKAKIRNCGYLHSWAGKYPQLLSLNFTINNGKLFIVKFGVIMLRIRSYIYDTWKRDMHKTVETKVKLDRRKIIMIRWM